MADRIATATVTATIKAVVEEYGEGYVYPPAKAGDNCRYVIDDKPSCLVGVVLARLGVPITHLKAGDASECNSGATADDLIPRLQWAGVVNFEEPRKVAHALRQAQYAQDVAYSWGIALERYEDALA